MAKRNRKPRSTLSEEQKQKKRNKSSFRVQKFNPAKTPDRYAIGIGNKRKVFESKGLSYISDEDGAEEIDSGSSSGNDDVSEILSAPSYSGPPSADRLSSSSNDPVCRKMEMDTHETILKVKRWLEQSVQVEKQSVELDKAFQSTMARNDARTRRAKAVFLASQLASGRVPTAISHGGKSKS